MLTKYLHKLQEILFTYFVELGSLSTRGQEHEQWPYSQYVNREG